MQVYGEAKILEDRLKLLLKRRVSRADEFGPMALERFLDMLVYIGLLGGNEFVQLVRRETSTQTRRLLDDRVVQVVQLPLDL